MFHIYIYIYIYIIYSFFITVWLQQDFGNKKKKTQIINNGNYNSKLN